MKAWAEAQQADMLSGQHPRAVGGGSQGHGVSHSRVLTWGAPQRNGSRPGVASLTDEEKLAAARRVFGEESPQLARMSDGRGCPGPPGTFKQP